MTFMLWLRVRLRMLFCNALDVTVRECFQLIESLLSPMMTEDMCFVGCEPYNAKPIEGMLA